MISLYNLKSNNKLGSSEISESNVLSYRRRSKLVSYNSYNNDNGNSKKSKDVKNVKNVKDINTIDTLKNSYNALYDLKNILTDYIKICKDENRYFTLTEQYYLKALINKIKTEILSVYHIFIKNVNLKKLNREEKKMIKNIDNLNQVLYFLYDDTDRLCK